MHQASIDSRAGATFAAAVSGIPIVLFHRQALVVGSFGSGADLASLPAAEVESTCDLIEIRLDLLSSKEREQRAWKRFEKTPLLFTARRRSEGGGGDLSASDRMNLIRSVLDDASLIDLEVASAGEMSELIDELSERGLPWVGSYHDFQATPMLSSLHAARENARNSGAAAFKAAFELGWNLDDVPALGQFITGSDFPTSLMGMGPFAPASRLLFAQLGSVLNYGYLGNTPTAPGQWSAAQLSTAIRSVRHLNAG